MSDQSISPKLKECPFCGGKAKELCTSKHTRTQSYMKPNLIFRYHVQCGRCSISTEKYKTVGVANKRWNRRA